MAYIGKSPSTGIRNRFIYTATAGQTSFSGSDDHSRTLSYTDAEFMDVFLNGVKLDKSDYTATSGTSVVLDEGAAVDDILEVVAYDTFSVFSGEFSADVTVGGTLTASADVDVTGTTTFSDDVDVNGNELILDADGDTSITADTDDQIDFKTGGTDAMHIDASQNVGIGASPARKFHIHEPSSGESVTHYTNSGTGSTSNDGFTVGLDLNEAGVVYMRENSYLYFGTNNTPRAGITSGGDFRAYEAIQTGLSVTGSYSSGEREVAAFAGGNQDYCEIVGRNVADTSHVIAAVIDGGAKFRVTAAGDGFFDGVGDGGPADFAEYFEWDDGNTSDEDRVGYSVVLTNGNKIRKATSNDAASDIIGIVSGRPAFVADTASLGWAGKYETDDYARRIKTDVTYYEWTDSEGKNHAYRADRIPDDVTVPSDADSRIRQEDAISSDYDSSQTYTPRSERQEWDAIGLLGKLSLRVGQPTGDRWLKLRDIATDDDGNVTIEQWLVR